MNKTHAEWAETLTDNELAAAIELNARNAPKDATFHIHTEAARRLRNTQTD